MSISALFIRRPVTTTLLAMALIIFGWIGYISLPVSDLPDVDFPTITVSASLPGADPETMASAVATPLEKSLSAIAGITSMNSVSSPGNTSITLQFDLSRNIDAAAQDVQAAISQASKSLPTEMTTPPSFKEVNPTAAPILYLAFTADHLPLTTLDNYAENIIAQRLSMISGVAQVLVYGSQQYAVRIDFNPQAIANLGLDLDQIENWVGNINTDQPSGILQGAAKNYIVKSNGQLSNAGEFAKQIITYANGAPVRLQDVATITDSTANNQIATWYNNQRAIVLAIQRQPGVNTVAVVKAIRGVLPQLVSDLPGGAKLNILYDRSTFIDASIKDMKFTLLLAIFLVVAVILLFLGNLASTTIALIALPVTLIGTFGIMYMMGYSLDNLSLMGIVLAVGFIIDDAIVVLENIIRHLELGKSKLMAALDGSKEIGFTVVSMTISLVAVFIPILFMGGLIGRLFNEFAMVVAIAILMSGVVSLTLTPMLCSRFLTINSHGGSLCPWFDKWFEGIKQWYGNSLQQLMERRRMVLILAGVTIVIAGIMFAAVGKNFIPEEDTGVIFANTQLPEGVTFQQLVQTQQKVADIIHKNPNVDRFISSVGQGQDGSASGNTGRLVITLKPFSERKLSSTAIIQQLMKQINTIPGIQVFMQNPPAIQIGGKMSSSNYQYVLQGTNWSELQTAATKMQTAMANIPGIQGLTDDLQMSNPEVWVKILRDKAAALGVTPAQIETMLYDAYGQKQISTIYTATDEYEVIGEIDPQYQSDPSVLSSLYVKSSSGTVVPLSSVAELQQTVGPMQINHYGQMPAVTLSFNLQPGASLGTITSQITHIAAKQLPADITGQFIGTAQTFQASLQTLPLLLLFTVLIIYMVLGVLYEHFIHPITILTALPFAGCGALVMLFIFHQQLDLFSFIGIIMLVGLVKKNGIMMVDFALEARRNEQLSAKEAMLKACLIRFRPIMMTTMAAILATLPIALGLGAGGEARRSMGIAVVGGLLFSQLLTLYATPIFYLYFDEWAQRWNTSRESKPCLEMKPDRANKEDF